MYYIYMWFENTPTIIIISNKPFCMTKWASYPPLPLIKSWMSKHWVMLMCLFSLGSMLTVGGGAKVQNCKETELWKGLTDWTEETTSLQWVKSSSEKVSTRKERKWHSMHYLIMLNLT